MDYSEDAARSPATNQNREIEVDLKYWIESLVDEVAPDLYATAYAPGCPQLRFKTFVIGGEQQEGELMIGYASTAVHAERIFKQGIRDYLDNFSGKTKLYWRRYPSINREIDTGLYTIYSRLLIINA